MDNPKPQTTLGMGHRTRAHQSHRQHWAGHRTRAQKTKSK